MDANHGRDLSLLERRKLLERLGGARRRYSLWKVGFALCFALLVGWWYIVMIKDGEGEGKNSFRGASLTEELVRDKVVQTVSKMDALGGKEPYPLEVCKKLAVLYHTCRKSNLMPTAFDVQTSTVICEFNIDENLAYIPDARIQDCLQRVKPVEWTQDAIKFEAKIMALQNPNDCSKPQSTVYIEPDWVFGTDSNGMKTRKPGTGKVFDKNKPKWELLTWLNHGWAYNLFVFAFNAANHWQSGVPVLVSNSKYRFSDLRCGRGWSCSLSPISKCSVETVPPNQILVFSLGESFKTIMSVDQLCKPYGVYEMEFGRCNCDDGFLPATDSKYFFCKPYSAFDFTITRKRKHKEHYEEDKRGAIEGRGEVWFANNAPGEENPHNTFNPVHYQMYPLRRKHGYMWTHAQALHFLMKNAPNKEMFDKRREELGLTNGRCIAIHVRHGDACHDPFQNHRVCLPLKKFIKAARKLVAEYGKFDKVFLATDDPGVIDDVPKFTDEFDIVYQKQDRSFYETGDHQGVDVREEFNTEDKVNEITSDIWIMSHCDAFVGSFASSVAWVSYEFMTARNGHHMPFVSVDMPYGHNKNVGRFYEGDEHEKH